jgi:hypothetical protein
MRNSAIAPDPRLSFTGIELARIPRDLLVKTRAFSYFENAKTEYSRCLVKREVRGTLREDTRLREEQRESASVRATCRNRGGRCLNWKNLL